MNLPDLLTEVDLLAPGPDASLLLSQLPDEDSSLFDFGNHSQLLRQSIDRGRASSVASVLLEDEPFNPSSALRRDSGIEIGRRATNARSMLDDDTTMQLDEPLDDGGIVFENLDNDEPLLEDNLNVPNVSRLEDISMNYDVGDVVPDLEPDVEAVSAPLAAGRARASASPLSSLRSSVERDLDQSFQQGLDRNMYEEDEASVHQAQRAKKRKVLQADTETEIHSNQIREQQNDRSKILKPASFLPRDPVLLALMEMQRSGGFVSSILGDERSKGWAPELRGVLSLEVVRGSADLKRKRDGGVVGSQDIPPADSLEVDGQDEVDMPAEDVTAGAEIDGGLVDIPADDETMQQPIDEGFELELEDGVNGAMPDGEDFDQTTMPLLHPSESGPVSLGTKHAVHLLRDRFGLEAEASSSKRQKSSVLFNELMPENTRTRADATKMFFEVLVLATKDAVKVEQAQDRVGGPLRVRAKRGLWGSWAETEAGGEIAEQAQQGSAVAA